MRTDNVYAMPILALSSAFVDGSISQKHYLQLTEASLATHKYDAYSHAAQQKPFPI